MKKRVLSFMLSTVLVGSMLSGCGGAQEKPDKDPVTSAANTGNTQGAAGAAAETAEPVTIEFQQWWEPELPDGSFQALIDQFEEENPDIKVKVLSAPSASNKELVTAGAATGTLADVVGLDGQWVYDFVRQDALANISDLMNESGYDSSELSSQVQVDGSTYMIPVINFVYPLFVNMDIMNEAGYTEMPKTQSEFTEMAKACAATGQNVAGFCMAMNLENPNGICNDILSWVWASGGKVFKDGKPALKDNKEVADVFAMMKELKDAGALTPGYETLKEQDKVDEFTNGRIGISVGTLAHLSLFSAGNPNMTYDICQIPVKDGYTGQSGLLYGSWGIGVAEHSEHKAEAFKLVAFLMRADINKELSALANALPGNKTAEPDFTDADPRFEKAFKDIYQTSYLENEFVGVPQSNELMRTLSEQFQYYLNGDITLDECLNKAQDEWDKIYEEEANR